MGVVTARDYTHDPGAGLDCEVLYQALVRSRDPRVKYIIWRGTITSGAGGPSPWVRKKYTGPNPHNQHLHLSVVSDKARYDDVRDWSTGLGGGAPAPQPPPTSGQPWLALPAVRSRPRSFQNWYNRHPFSPPLLPVISPVADTFGPQSEAALKKVQARYGLTADGIDGPKTKKLLWDLGWRG
jgi:peptidoglycan hydrolase-like protein with peptidoglycan-binding domain